MTQQRRIRRTARIVGALAFAVGPVGCGTSSPAEPSQPALAIITGRVIDGSNVPVAGARVTATDRFRGPIESISDAAGGYTLTIDLQNKSLTVMVEKDGFEPSRLHVGSQVAPLSRAMAMDLRLYAITRILAGDSIRLEVRPEDPVCAGPSGLEAYPCRRVRISSPASGRLGVGAMDAYGDSSAVHNIVVQQADKPPASEGLVIAVQAGSETIVEFMLLGQPSQSLIAVSWLEPS
jgi:hypothetical protein